jgi:hemolysin activation/secretion protein
MNKIYSVLVITLLLGNGSAVASAAPVVPDAGLIMRESAKTPELPKKATDIDIETPVPRKPMAAQSNLHVKVLGFTFSGNSQIPTSVLQALLKSYTHRELSFDDLQKTVEVITRYYRTQGFLVAYAYLPEQTLNNGQVEIAIIEGHLDGEHLKGKSINRLNDTRINKQVLQNFLDTLPKGSLISEGGLNELSLRLNQLPGINAKLVLAPGKETGTSSLAVKVKEATLISAYTSADNSGLYATGYYRFDGGVSINDPLGMGDQLNLRVQTTETGGAVSGWADYNTAINGYGTRLGVSFSEMHYALGRSFTPLQGSGYFRSVGAALTQPLLLNRNGQLTGSARYDHRWLEDDLDAVDSSNARELNVANFSLSGSMNDVWLTEPAVTQAFINVAAGEVSFTNGQAYLNDQSTGLNKNGGYHKFNGLVNRTQTVWGPFSLYGSFYGQVASKNLDGSEHISLGGPNGIRAYPVGEGNADEGWLANVETRYRLPKVPFFPGYLQVIGFIDAGYAHVNALPLPGSANNSEHLAGYGFGINWLEAQGFSLRTSLAWRDTDKQPGSDLTATGPMGYFQLSRLF